MTSTQIELAVVKHLGFRENTIVPNVSWGLFRDDHEADIVILRQSGWADEVEIKTTRSDIRADLKKHRGAGHRRNAMIHKLWFAVPEKLKADPDIPCWAGILSVSDNGRVEAVRGPSINKAARRMTPDEQQKLMRLGCMRIWTLKTHMMRYQKGKPE